jgi:hypothetical protein
MEPPTGPPAPDDLTQLEQAFPAWRFEITWVTGNSGPDARIITAASGNQTVAGWTPAAVAEQIRQIEGGR